MEINAKNIQNTWSDIDSIRFDRMGAEIVYRMLVGIGASRDITFHWDKEYGKIHIMKKVYVPMDDSKLFENAERYYSLNDYIKTLIRWDRSAYKRMKNVEQKINQMHAGIEALKKQL